MRSSRGPAYSPASVDFQTDDLRGLLSPDFTGSEHGEHDPQQVVGGSNEGDLASFPLASVNPIKKRPDLFRPARSRCYKL